MESLNNPRMGWIDQQLLSDALCVFISVFLVKKETAKTCLNEIVSGGISQEEGLGLAYIKVI